MLYMIPRFVICATDKKKNKYWFVKYEQFDKEPVFTKNLSEAAYWTIGSITDGNNVYNIIRNAVRLDWEVAIRVRPATTVYTEPS